MILDLLFLPQNDWRYSRTFIDLLPLRACFKYLEFRNNRLNFYINAASVTDARGWASIINGFGGKVESQKLLPFQDDNDSSINHKIDNLNQPKESTIKSLRLLYQQRKIPRPVLIELGYAGILKEIVRS